MYLHFLVSPAGGTAPIGLKGREGWREGERGRERRGETGAERERDLLVSFVFLVD